MKYAYAVLLSLVVFSQDVSAQVCPRYAASDRGTIKDIFTVMFAPSPDWGHMEGGIQFLLMRMNELASYNSFSALSYFQKSAVALEYQALLKGLRAMSTNPPKRLTPLGRRFVSLTTSPEYLGLAGTTVYGATDEEAIANSKAASAALKKAASKLWRCF